MGLIVFFFSSRRRHTRYWRDWSSDVCSSDLFEATAVTAAARRPIRIDSLVAHLAGGTIQPEVQPAADGDSAADPGAERKRYRSEERRVGKECRSRGSPYH